MIVRRPPTAQEQQPIKSEQPSLGPWLYETNHFNRHPPDSAKTSDGDKASVSTDNTYSTYCIPFLQTTMPGKVCSTCWEYSFSSATPR